MKWKCLRCKAIFESSNKKCDCVESPSPWVPLKENGEEMSFDEWYEKHKGA